MRFGFVACIASSCTILIYFIIFAYLVASNFVLNGVLRVVYDFENESPFISLLKPRGRVNQEIIRDEKTGDHYQKLLFDPVYFDVSLPKHFDSVDVDLVYKNKSEPLIELGLSRGEDDERFILKSMEHGLLDRLLTDPSWTVIKEEELIFLQKKKKYDSLSAFLKNPPPINTIGVYQYDLPNKISMMISNERSLNTTTELNRSLRGAHTMVTYISDGQDFNMRFNLQDMNRLSGADAIVIRILKDGREVYIKKLDDDGVFDDSFTAGRPFDSNVFLAVPGAGVYTIKFESSEDIFIRSLKINSPYLVFSGGVYLADNVGYLNDRHKERYQSSVLFTNAEKLSAITSHVEGFQDIRFGSSILSLTERDSIVTASESISTRRSLMQKFEVSKSDIKLLGRGLFSFSKESFFNPYPLILHGDVDLNPSEYGINYIVAHYNSPVIEDGGWHRQSVKFDFNALRDNDNNHRFIISFPYSNGGSSEFAISLIGLTLHAKPMSWRMIFDRVIRLDFFKRNEL